MDEVVSRALGEQPAPRVGAIEPFELVEHLDTADRHKDAGVRLSGTTRFAGAKRALLRVVRMYTTEQAAFNHAVLASLHSLNHNIESARVEADQRMARTQAAVTSTEMTVNETVEALRTAVARLADDRATERTELAMLRSRVDLFLEEARRRLPEPFSEEQLRTLTAEADDAWLSPLYAQLEERFRGSRAEVQALQKAYLDDIAALGPAAVVLDIGCGRGEWLELLRDNDITAYGVDTNEPFVAQNVERGLDVRLGDALEHLASLEEGTLGAVTGFHIVEHLEFPTVVRLVDAALRALRPGGILLFETPNPTNVMVGSASFYLDPTHRNPVHPHFLQFLLEARGFAKADIRWLHPAQNVPFTAPGEGTSAEAMQRLVEHLNWAFFGPLDYAVIGRKARA